MLAELLPERRSKNSTLMMPDADEISRDSLPAIGAIIDSRYQLIEGIGSGATGAVYKAKHVGIGRMVAVKLAKPDVGSLPEVAARFEREALAIGLISHPNCVAVLDSGQLPDGTRFLVMELLKGRSLADLLDAQERLSVNRALHIARHILRGLSHVHNAKVVHRDIKPENIFLVEMEQDEDFAKILDFGLAKLLTETSDEVSGKPLTRAGMTFGTPRYMSPEQVCGKPVDARSDLYSLSVLLYELIAGRPPFEGEDPMAVLPMHLTCEPPRISELGLPVEILPELEEIILRGLEKKPERRFASAMEYLAAIDEVCDSDWAAEQTPMPTFFPSDSQLAIDARDYQKMREREPVEAVVDRSAVTRVLAAESAELSVPVAASTETAPESKAIAFSKLHLYYGAAILALVAAAGLWFFLAGPRKLDLIHEAQVLVDDGNPNAAIALLQAKPERIEKDSAGLLLLARAYDATKNYDDSAIYYIRAILLDAEIARDETLREDLRTHLREGSVATRKTTLSVLETIVKATGDETAKGEIIGAASAHPKRPTRHAALAMAEALGLAAEVDRLRSYTLDLTEPDSCPLRKQAIADLRKLGDKRAVPVLEDARERRRNKKNTNLCLRAAAEEAIGHLQSLP